MEEFVKLVASWATALLEMAAALLILIAAIQALLNYFTYLISGKQSDALVQIRLKLGSGLSLALEFLLGADILQTAIAPTWDEIGQLAAIAVLRTALNYFLERELRAEETKP